MVLIAIIMMVVPAAGTIECALIIQKFQTFVHTVIVLSVKHQITKSF